VHDKDARLQWARRAVGAVFFVHGAVFASWAARIPAIQEELHLPSASLGVVLAGPGLGALAGSQIGGKLVDLLGSRKISALAPIILCVPLGLIPIATSTWPLMVLLVLLGAADGSTAVAMNAQAVAVQEQCRRPVLNGMHATRSIGAVAGGGGGAVTAAFGLPLTAQFAATAVILAGISAVAAVGLLPEAHITGTRGAPASRGRMRVAVALLALITFLAALIEDAPASWSGVYLRQLGSTQAVAASGYAIFSAGEVIGRLYSDRLVTRFGWGRLIRAGTLSCAAGLIVALLLGQVEVTLAALVIVGIGISAVFPGAFAGAGAVPGADPGVTMGQVNFAGNLGWLAVSPIIGGIATAFSLPIALGLLPIAAMIIAILAFSTEPQGR